MSEAWLDIPDTSGLYQASSLGRIRSCDRTIERLSRWGRPSSVRLKGRVLKPWASAGYSAVYLCVDGARIAHNVHRLVARTFHGEPDGDLDVNHKDGDKHNDAPWNLEWCTRAENVEHAIQIGLLVLDRPVVGRPVAGGETVTYPSAKSACIAFGLGRTAVASAARGDRATAGGYRWKYADALDWPPLPAGYQPRKPRSKTFAVPLAA